MTESGICQCGCGEPTNPAPFTSAARGWTKGEPLRFLHGHGNRVRRKALRYVIEDRGYRTSCWVWQLKIDRDGYAKEWANGKDRRAARLAWERVNGPIPPGFHLDHLCRVRACVNPDHLEPVTCAENIRRGALAKLTMVDAATIRDLRGEGLTLAAIALRFGITVSAVNNVVRGTHWRS